MKDTAFEPIAGQARTAYFDYLKVVQYFLLMVVHTASYQWYSADINSTSWLVLNFYKSSTRPCVLLFFMISGALMLGKDIPIRKIYRKYVLKLAIVFIAWDIIYAVITYWNDGIHGIIFKMFNSNYHLWYLLAMIGLYICFPLMKLIAENKKTMRYFMILSFVFAFLLPTVFELCSAFGGHGLSKLSGFIAGHVYDMHMWTVMGYPFFFIAGYYIHTNDFNRISRIIIYIAGIISTVSGAAINALFIRSQNATLDTFNNSFMLYEMIPAIAVFTFFKYNIRGNVFLDRIVFRISSWGLGIYMVHDLVILGVNTFLGLNGMSFNPLFAVPAVALIALILSSAISALLNLIPGVKKYLV